MKQFGSEDTLCPIARAADLIADRWTILILRELRMIMRKVAMSLSVWLNMGMTPFVVHAGGFFTQTLSATWLSPRRYGSRRLSLHLPSGFRSGFFRRPSSDPAAFLQCESLRASGTFAGPTRIDMTFDLAKRER
jgi:hypothetical protein